MMTKETELIELQYQLKKVITEISRMKVALHSFYGFKRPICVSPCYNTYMQLWTEYENIKKAIEELEMSTSEQESL